MFESLEREEPDEPERELSDEPRWPLEREELELSLDPAFMRSSDSFFDPLEACPLRFSPEVLLESEEPLRAARWVASRSLCELRSSLRSLAMISCL